MLEFSKLTKIYEQEEYRFKILKEPVGVSILTNLELLAYYIG
jgi:hypothetical protein